MAPTAPLSEWLTTWVVDATPIHGVMRLLVNDFFIPVGCVLILIGLWFGVGAVGQRERIQRGVLAAFASFGLANLVVWIFNHGFKFDPWPRPFVDIPSAAVAAKLLFYFPTDPSFPSNGAAALSAFATCIWFVNRKAGAVLYFLTFLWCFARLCSGIHYLEDILAGVAIGVVMSFLVFKLVFPRIEPVLRWIFRTARRLYLA